jgi:hypothetical protein
MSVLRSAGLALASLALALCMAVVAQPATAQQRHALLVGVSEYPGLDRRDWLAGPRNDIRLILDFLAANPALGFARENMTVLADGVDGADGLPTLEAIGQAMDGIAEAAGEGDFVYLHFAGHGSRQAARNPALEENGLDEVFLPADTLPASGGIYPNALVDDDIGAAIDRMRARGAFVWIVFDSCHSASATRSADTGDTGMRERRMPDAAAPTGNLLAMEAAPIGPGDTGADETAPAGGLVAFFAAQTVETTPEMRLPRNDPDAETLGLFTHTLFSVLARNPGISYRQLAQGIAHAYAGANLSRPVPVFEGDLDRAVFDAALADTVLQWPVEVSPGSLRIAAGSLHGLSEGAILALYDDPLAPDDAAFGHLKLGRTGPLSALAAPFAHDGLPAPNPSTFDPTVVARPSSVPVSFELAVHVAAGGPDFAAAHAAASQAVTRIAADESFPVNLRIVEDAGAADLRLIVTSAAALYGDGESDEARLWFLPPDGTISADPRMRAHSIGLGHGLDAEREKVLGENLAAVFRATSLSRLSELSTLEAEGFAIELSTSRGDLSGRAGFDGSAVPQVDAGDVVQLAIRNESRLTIDVDVLMIGPDYSIRHMMYDRFYPGGTVDSPLVGFGPANPGERRFIVVARETRRHLDRTDLSYLQQVGVQTRGPAASGARSFNDLIADIALAPARRSAVAIGSREGRDLGGSVSISRVLLRPSG